MVQGRSVTSKVLAILDAFGPTRTELTLYEIARRASLPPPTAHRLLAELVGWGAIERTAERSYRVGLRLWEVAALAPRGLGLRDLALPFLEDLYEVTHEHVQLAVLDNLEALFVEKISGRSAVPIVTRVGGRLPLHATAVGQVLLAHADPSVLDDVLARGLPRFTDNTITSARRLRRVLADIRLRGEATCWEQLTYGAVSVAAPVAGDCGTVVAGLSVVVPTSAEDVRRLVPAVQAAARGISRAVRGAGSSVGVVRR
jgi:DNA-binding IclR family transcriptional regulator